MPPVLGESGLFVGGQSVLSVRRGASQIWSGGGLVLPAIGEPLQGGFYAGLISLNGNGVATHALIVAPRATGASGTGYPVTTGYQWKTSTAATAGTQSLFDGKANTDAMAAAGLSAHPAAQFCRGLSIGGFSDWYLPAQLELDIAYHHLKPSTSSNSTSAGINAYAVPQRPSNRTASVPAQTAVLSFCSGGEQAFDVGGHMSSTERNDGTISFRGFAYGNGILFSDVKTVTSYRVRAFRRVAL